MLIATKVIVEFIENEFGEDEIHITDDGVGMNFDEVKKYWMRIATTVKAKDSVFPIYGILLNNSFIVIDQKLYIENQY